MPDQNSAPSPALLFDAINSYQRSAAIKAAIELDLFSAIGEGKTTATEIATRCDAAERGIRILCDYLVIKGFLTKQDRNYGLTRDSAIFLDKNSPAYFGGVTEFMLSQQIMDNFRDLTAIVRNGGSLESSNGCLAPEHPVWMKFARAMVPMMAKPAQSLAQLTNGDSTAPVKILDIAAGHGVFGIAFAQKNPNAEIVAQDWPNVLEVARENAEKAGIANRWRTLPGSAFAVDFGDGYDIVLLTNILHHFDKPTCEGLLKKVHQALAPGGRAVALEFIPNEDRVTPPDSAAFSLTMLASTPGGDAYTFAELQALFASAGFSHCDLHELPVSMNRVAVGAK